MRQLSICMMSLVGLFSLMMEAHADELRDKVEAAYLYRICSYINWPAETFRKVDSPIVIGILSNDSLAEKSATLVRGRHVKGRPVVTRRIQQLNQLNGVHLLYVGQDSEQVLSLPQFMSGHPPIVTVTREIKDRSKSMINFVLDSDHIRFDIVNSLAKEAGIRFDADLLSVARAIY